MEERVKNRWLKALRSGEYKQGRRRLHIVDAEGNDFYCCLGVLCEIHAEETGGHWERHANHWWYLGNLGALPKEVMEWSGIRNPTGELEAYKSLIKLNDSGEYDFSQIADVIDEHWWEL